MMLGIDFGTSNSAAALVAPSGELIAIPLDAGKTSMPTALFFSNEDGHVAYGSAAMQAYLSGTDGRLMRSIKSLLGSSLMDEQTLVNGKLTSLFEVVVMFLQEIKARSEKHLGFSVSSAMLGRPVHFVDDDAARDQLAQDTLERAALAAGFTHVQFQLEPIAAAFDFERRVEADTTVLVVDIGGGTSDFTVIQVGPGRYGAGDRAQDLLATTGVHLGGTDFDRLLHLENAMPLLGLGHVGPSGRAMPSSMFFDLSTWHLIQQCYGRARIHQAQEMRSDYKDRMLHDRLMLVLEERLGHQLLATTEAAKIECSISDQPVQMDLSSMGIRGAVGMTPQGMHDVLHATLDQVVACAHECVRQAGIGRPQVVYLTGGSSALTPLQAAVQDAFVGAEVVVGDRFGSVAAGLAYGASALTESKTGKPGKRGKSGGAGSSGKALTTA